MPDSPTRSEATQRDTARVAGRESRRDTGRQEDPLPGTRIAVFAPPLRLNGATLYARILLRALREADDKVLLVAPTGPMAETFSGTYDRWFELPRAGRLGFFEWRRLRDAVAEFNPAVCHVVAPDPTLPAVRIAREFGLRLVVSVHGIKPDELPEVGDQRYDAFLASDQSVRERLMNDCRLPRTRTVLVPDAVFPENPPDELEVLDGRRRPVVGWVGPLVENCGHESFIDAAIKIQARGLDAMFSILGSGPLGDQVRDSVEERGMLQRIVVVQSLYDYSRIWAPFDIAVVDSRQTCAAIMVLHAMANGRPVVATEGGSVFDLIEDSRDGFIVPRDNADALAERLEALINNPVERLRMARAAFEKVEFHHHPQPMARALKKVYRALIADEPLPRHTDTTKHKVSGRRG